MSYAKVRVHLHPAISYLTNRLQIALLPPEYGLYSSFVGVFIYCVRIYGCFSLVQLADSLAPVLVRAAVPVCSFPYPSY